MDNGYNVQLIRNSLCSLGAHLGHLKVDAYQNLSYYVLGGRSSFVIIDLDKTVPMLKSALVFFEQMVTHYGHAVFCHSSIIHLNLHIRYYIARVVNERNQSFSYWKWVPGCITNYRYVFLRLVELMFSEIRAYADDGDVDSRLRTSYNRSFFVYYKKLWLWFIHESNVSLAQHDAVMIGRMRALFNTFFIRSKKSLLTKYLTDTYNRNIYTYEFVRAVSGTALSSEFSEIRKSITHRFMRIKRAGTDSLRTLPSFVSLLFRVCYVIKHKEVEIRHNFNTHAINDEELFQCLFSRIHVFWRAIIFFKCFRKTANLPDCLFMCNTDDSVSEFNDFIGVRLPIICLSDTTTDISSITYPIPSNDDSIVLFLFYLFLFINACNSAHSARIICP